MQTNNTTNNTINNTPSTMDNAQTAPAIPSAPITAPELSELHQASVEALNQPQHEGAFCSMEEAKKVKISDNTATLIVAMRNLLEVESAVFSAASSQFLFEGDLTRDISNAFSATRDVIGRLMIEIIKDNIIDPEFAEI